MKIIELNNIADELSWDSADDVYDSIILLEMDRFMFKGTLDPLYEFTKAVYEKVDVVKIFKGAFASIICKWSALFEDNIDLWKEYTKTHWSPSYHNLLEEDKEEYIVQLLDSMHGWLTGGAATEHYRELIEIVKKCK